MRPLEPTAHALFTNPKLAAEFGHDVARVLELRPTRDGCYKTNWGEKTACALGRTVLEMVEGHMMRLDGPHKDHEQEQRQR